MKNIKHHTSRFYTCLKNYESNGVDYLIVEVILGLKQHKNISNHKTMVGYIKTFLFFLSIYSTRSSYFLCANAIAFLLHNVREGEIKKSTMNNIIMMVLFSVTGSDDCTYSKHEKIMSLKKDKNGNIIPDYKKL